MYAASWITAIRPETLQGDGAEETSAAPLWRRAIYRIQISAFSTHLHKAISAFSDEKSAARPSFIPVLESHLGPGSPGFIGNLEAGSD